VRRHPLAAAAALALLSQIPVAARAQDVPPGGDPQARTQGTKLERVELSSRPQSDTELRRKAPVAKQIYGREEMDKYGDTNLSDVLRRLPGVDMQGGGPRMRGLGAGYTLILINGDPAPPGFALDQLSPSQVERIEITKGPSADQSAQAVAGAINIILKDAPKVSQRDLRVGLGYAAVRPTPNFNFTYGERKGDVSVSVPVSAFEWRNESEFATQRQMSGNDGLPASSSQSGIQPQWGHGFNSAPRLNWKISDEESLAAQLFLQKGYWNTKQIFEEVDGTKNALFDSPSVNRGSWENQRLGGQWSRRFNDTQKLELKAGVSRSTGTFDNLSFISPTDQRHSVGINVDRSLTQAGKFGQLLGDSHSLSVGWDLEWRRRSENRTVTEAGKPQLPGIDGQPYSADIQRQAFYAQDEWEITPQWSAYFGLRNERIVTESQMPDGDIRNTSSVLTPLLHLNYKLDAKGRDLIRASLTRSYKAPDLNALVARPSLSGLYPDTSQVNNPLSPDRMGNPLLRPELATGLDLAFEKYFTGGGMMSVGVFYRQVNDLIRSVTSLQTVGYAPVQRWVSRPENFSKAQSSGLELEVKGRAGELMPTLFDPKLALNLRAALNIYHSNVEAVPLPNNRLDSQQPWSANLGFDYRFTSLPLTTGGSLAYIPGYTTQQTLTQQVAQSDSRSLDMFAQWSFSRQTSMRVSLNNIAPLQTWSDTSLSSGEGTQTQRKNRTMLGLALEMKL